MELTTAEIRIGGDLRNTVVRDVTRPITVPEIEVLKMVHGEGAILPGKVCGTVDRGPKAEKKRLVEIYGLKVVDQIYPGINGNGMDMGEKPAPKKKAAAAKPASDKEIV